MDEINAEITKYNNLMKLCKDNLVDVESNLIKLNNEKLSLAKKDYEDKMKSRKEEFQQLCNLKAVEEEKMKIVLEQIEAFKRKTNFYKHKDAIDEINNKINVLVRRQFFRYDPCNCDKEYNILNIKVTVDRITTCRICGHEQHFVDDCDY